MAVYIGHDECQVIYVAKNGQQRRVSSVWVGDQQVFPPANRQEIHLFTRDTQGYGREDHGTFFGFTVPVPWWATSMDVVLLGAGEKGRDGTKSFIGGSDGAGGRSGAWVVATHSLTPSSVASIVVGKGTTTTPYDTYVYIPGAGEDSILVTDSQGTRTANSGSTGGSVTPYQRADYGATHTGGAGGTRNADGIHPGGGGGGGQGSGLIGNPTTGRNGGDGRVWLRFRSAPALNPGDDRFILRVGVTSGWASVPLREWAVGIGQTYQTITEITVPMEVIGPSLQGLFQFCTSLESVPELDTSQVTNARYLFSSCSSLTSIPDLDTSQVTGMNYMFAGCSSLTSVPDLDTSQVTVMQSMFDECTSLTTIPGMNTSQVTDMRTMFYGCTALTTIPALDSSRVNDVGYMFNGCSSLESVTLPGMGNGYAGGSDVAFRTLDMRDTKLSVAAANALMHSLGTPAPGGILQLPRTASGAGTEADVAVAKNWQVTFG